jgi:hypothetical protein
VRCPHDDPLRFSITGPIAAWDPVGRALGIGDRDLWLTPDLSIASLARGAQVTASGHRDNTTTRWVVTQLTLVSNGGGHGRLTARQSEVNPW